MMFLRLLVAVEMRPIRPRPVGDSDMRSDTFRSSELQRRHGDRTAGTRPPSELTGTFSANLVLLPAEIGGTSAQGQNFASGQHIGSGRSSPDSRRKSDF